MVIWNDSFPQQAGGIEWREPFPEPRTIPAGWDTSEFMPVPWPFVPARPVKEGLPFYVFWSGRLRAALLRVGDFVSSLSHSLASR